MYSPAWLDPTKLMALMAGWSQMKFTAAEKYKHHDLVLTAAFFAAVQTPSFFA